MSSLNNEKLIEYIAELEARLFTVEQYINDFVGKNKLKIATSTEVQVELRKQRNRSVQKYNNLINP